MVRRTLAVHPSTLALLASLVIVGGGLRWLAFETARPVATLGDENYYAEVADNIARGRGHLYVGELEGESLAWRPPAHAWLLSLAADADGSEGKSPTLISGNLPVEKDRLEAVPS